MKFLIAPDKFKGSLSATDAANCIAQGIRTALPDAETDLCPVADGGEGTVTAIHAAAGGRLITRRVTGPLPEMKVDATFAMLADNTTAVIEVSAASGLALVPIVDRNPLNTTTFGTGELIAAAVREGAKKIILGLGGSATIDAGIGCAQACGFTILTRDGEPISRTEPLCGRDLSNVLAVKHGRGEITSGIEIVGATDVASPLLGPLGAAHIYGPQKGGSPLIVDHLDTLLRELARRTGVMTEAEQPGTGAAGGLGFAVQTFFRGKLESGFDLTARMIRLSDRFTGTDLCMTGEGRLDLQSLAGKAVIGVADRCKNRSVPCVALVGSYNADLKALHRRGITAVFSICDGPISLESAVTNTGRLLTQTAENCVRLWMHQLMCRPE
jgi:glycerate kinase